MDKARIFGQKADQDLFGLYASQTAVRPIMSFDVKLLIKTWYAVEEGFGTEKLIPGLSRLHFDLSMNVCRRKCNQNLKQDFARACRS